MTKITHVINMKSISSLGVLGSKSGFNSVYLCFSSFSILGILKQEYMLICVIN